MSAPTTLPTTTTRNTSGQGCSPPAAISFGRGRRTLSVSRSEGEAYIGFGGDMRRADDVPENEYGESSWHDHVHCALALTSEALDRWRRLRDPAVRAGVGAPCPMCRGRLEDLDSLEPGLGLGKGLTPGGFLRLRCANCTTLFRTSRRRTAELELPRMQSHDKEL